MSTEEQEQTPYRGYGHDLDTMIAAAIKWFADHHAAYGEHAQVPKLHWHEENGATIIGDLAEWAETIAGNAAGSAFLRAVNAAVSGRATVIMAQTAHHEAMRADAS